MENTPPLLTATDLIGIQLLEIKVCAFALYKNIWFAYIGDFTSMLQVRYSTGTGSDWDWLKDQQLECLQRILAQPFKP